MATPFILVVMYSKKGAGYKPLPFLLYIKADVKILFYLSLSYVFQIGCMAPKQLNIPNLFFYRNTFELVQRKLVN